MRRMSPMYRLSLLALPGMLSLAAAVFAAPMLCAQTPPAGQTSPATQAPEATQTTVETQTTATDAGPIAIVPLTPEDSKNPDKAAKVTGALEVSQGKAIIVASGTVTSGTRPPRLSCRIAACCASAPPPPSSWPPTPAFPRARLPA